ncbi:MULTISPECIES: hypothetical protein [unclassified Isoptericola]|uniref:hypothetical protein n=1 Tax=unclassified Isoptericola TaxID=2623355 RepID=UPI003665D29F
MSTETVQDPPRRRPRVGWWVTLAVVAVVVVTGVAQIFPLARTADVAVPPPDATAEDVVRAYLTALDAHDCATAQALTAPEFATTTESMCHDVSSLEITDLETVGTGAVNAGFDVDWRFFADDTSIPEGGFGWTYYLTRDPEGWRIEDAGNG